MEVNKKKAIQLGMPFGTASNRLKKKILFYLVKNLKLNKCFQCRKIIHSEHELSVEHKVPYLDSKDPLKLFFDLTNIAFSHLKCNISTTRHKKGFDDPRSKHGPRAYRRGCRCNICKEAQRKHNKKFRKVRCPIG